MERTYYTKIIVSAVIIISATAALFHVGYSTKFANFQVSQAVATSTVNSTSTPATTVTTSSVATSSTTTTGTDVSAQGTSTIHYIPTSPSTSGVTSSIPRDKLLEKMTLSFEDNFDTFSRYTDAKGNITCEPGGIGRWQTVYHFCSRSNFGNYENQIYVDQNFIDYLEKSTGKKTTATVPISVSNGILRIEAKPSDELIQKSAGSWAKYTSGMITTQFSFSQLYGYFEMRAKVPRGEGVWPAFWLLPVDKSWPPEIDVMESFGGYNDKGEGGLTQVHYASHAVQKNKSCGDWHDVGVDITSDYHVYGVDFQADHITYYFDGIPYATCPPNPDFNKPLYMLVNLAIGSKDSWPGAPDATNVWPVYMYVDYVRAYKNK